MQSTAGSLSSIIADVSSLVTAVIGWIGEFVTVIVSNPILLIGVLIGLTGLAVGMISRLMRL